MEAKIISRKIVKPSVPTPGEHRTCKLSFFDQLAPSDHIPIIFFYRNTKDLDEKLVKSLSETLTKYYPFAGRFVEDGYYIDCNDKGVEYIEAEINNFELGEFLRVAPKNMHLLNDLALRDNFGETHLVTTPIFGCKVSKFKCGGVAICMYLSHKVADGFTAATFYHAWSSTSRLGTKNHEELSSSPSFCLASLFPARDLSVAIKPEPVTSSGKTLGTLVTKRFVFDEKAISKLKAKVSYRANINGPTRVEVVTSVIWKTLIRIAASQSKGVIHLRDSALYLYLNLRGRTSTIVTPPPPPDDDSSLCGNFYIQVPIKFKADNSSTTKMEEFDELHELVNLLRGGLGKAVENCRKISTPDGLVTEVANYVNGIRENMGNEDVDVRFFSTLCRFPFYEVDFGWGKPEWVTTIGMPLEVVFLMDTKCGTGIVATVTLNETGMLQFERHPDMIAFTS